jgi:hypothetical protein
MRQFFEDNTGGGIPVRIYEGKKPNQRVDFSPIGQPSASKQLEEYLVLSQQKGDNKMRSSS